MFQLSFHSLPQRYEKVTLKKKPDCKVSKTQYKWRKEQTQEWENTLSNVLFVAKLILQ